MENGLDFNRWRNLGINDITALLLIFNCNQSLLQWLFFQFICNGFFYTDDRCEHKHEGLVLLRKWECTKTASEMPVVNRVLLIRILIGRTIETDDGVSYKPARMNVCI
ncbi:hypothetical protein LOAG_03060 [Loa loa]|uniref:Uncharacterized protein n=1 Tax=Loa loa TaxID=7209 RepID=A0A1S0U591_LOALO|nr:hypothetical protein LOAG_03060 [Loa loa]EFO25426.1 hypothetical protein LOAG_03060 [Loa loa]